MYFFVKDDTQLRLPNISGKLIQSLATKRPLCNKHLHAIKYLSTKIRNKPEAIFIVVCDPPMNELLATQTGICIYLYGSRSLTARS
jgi:hypothetical protein